MTYDVSLGGSVGALITITPMTERGQDWCAEYLFDADEIAGQYPCEPAYVVDIVGAMEADGLVIDKLCR